MIRCDFITDWRTGLDNRHVEASEQSVCKPKQVKSSIEHGESSKQGVCETKQVKNSIEHEDSSKQGVCEPKQVKNSIEHGECSKQSVCERFRSLNSEVENSSCESSGDESEIECEEPVRKKRKVDDFNELYDNIKLKVEKRMQDNEEHFESPDLDAVDMSDRRALLDTIKQLDKNHQRKVLIDYINLGDMLYNLKLLYVKKCDKCVEDNQSDGLSCKRCINLSDVKGFFSDVKNIVSYVNNHINFLINISRLNKLYSKFKYISCSVSRLQPHMGKLHVKMLNDEDFWK